MWGHKKMICLSYFKGHNDRLTGPNHNSRSHVLDNGITTFLNLHIKEGNIKTRETDKWTINQPFMG